MRVDDEAEMRALGEKIGRVLPGGLVIELIGDVGAGKTTLTKGIATGMGIDEPIQSPTFTISRIYDALDGRRLAHYDLYRLQDAGIMTDEMAEVFADSDTITVIEWGGVVEGVLPNNRLIVKIIAIDESTRSVEILAVGDKAKAVSLGLG